MNLHKFTVSLNENDAVRSTQMSHEYRDKELGAAIRRENVFDTANEAFARLDELLTQDKADGECEPSHECGRCVNWPPQVFEVAISATKVSRETFAEGV